LPGVLSEEAQSAVHLRLVDVIRRRLARIADANDGARERQVEQGLARFNSGRRIGEEGGENPCRDERARRLLGEIRGEANRARRIAVAPEPGARRVFNLRTETEPV